MKFAWTLVPYPIRLAFIAAVLALIAFLLWRLDAALDAHYTGQQNQLVLEDAARTNAATVKRLEGQHERDQKLLAAREARIAALERKGKESDDEMQRLKNAKPENRKWAEEPVPPDIAARHRL